MTVYLTTNPDTRTGSRVYHTDPECHYVDTGNMREVSEDLASEVMGFEECSHCAGDVDRSHTGPTLAYQVVPDE